DLLSLIGLATVMAVQDPVMSLLSVIVVPPAMLILRKMIRRIKTIAFHQFTGSTRILETLQGTLQGMRTLKAFTLEDGMRARFDMHVAEVEKESNKWARIAYRSGPLMEALGGFAIAGALVYGGFRVIETGATPGQFFSFLAAFMLAYEPAKRLARLNIDLNSGLVGVRVLFDIIDHPPTEQPDNDKPPLALSAAYVGQDVFLFRGSVRENIALGRPGATEAEIVAAAKAAYAHDFIMAFPRGYDTPVGEHGMRVAGGERQRISVARALLKDAPVILLDEATASLDSESERQVQRAIERLCRGRTTIVIAHRLHTVVDAHRIFVIEDGAVSESGRHDDLLRKGGRYASFYRLQLRNQEPPRPDVA